jgi:hypothetical protein
VRDFANTQMVKRRDGIIYKNSVARVVASDLG